MIWNPNQYEQNYLIPVSKYKIVTGFRDILPAELINPPH